MGPEGGGNYIQGADKDAATRNSGLRAAVGPAIESGMIIFHETFPGVTADHLTDAGCAGNIAVAVSAAVMPNDAGWRKKTAHTVGIAAFSGLDAVDGSLARVTGTASAEGARRDARRDRISEEALALSRARQARQRGDLAGELLAYGAAITGVLPSLVRAYQESRGIVVREAPKRPDKIPGSAFGRRIASAVSTPFANVQKTADAWTIYANLAVTRDRINEGRTNEPTLSEEKRAEAKARYNDAKKLTAAAVVGSALLAVGMRLAERQSDK